MSEKPLQYKITTNDDNIVGSFPHYLSWKGKDGVPHCIRCDEPQQENHIVVTLKEFGYTQYKDPPVMIFEHVEEDSGLKGGLVRWTRDSGNITDFQCADGDQLNKLICLLIETGYKERKVES